MQDFLNSLPNIDNADIRLFAAAVDATSNGVVITDHMLSDEPIIYCNRGFQDLTGYTKKEIIGHTAGFYKGTNGISYQDK